MKMIKYWEVPNPEDMDTAIARWQSLLKAMEKEPKKYPTYVFPPHGIGQTMKGISVLDVQSEEQLIHYILALTPPFKVKFEPLIDGAKTIGIYLQSKEE